MFIKTILGEKYVFIIDFLEYAKDIQIRVYKKNKTQNKVGDFILHLPFKKHINKYIITNDKVNDILMFYNVSNSAFQEILNEIEIENIILNNEIKQLTNTFLLGIL